MVGVTPSARVGQIELVDPAFAVGTGSFGSALLVVDDESLSYALSRAVLWESGISDVLWQACHDAKTFDATSGSVSVWLGKNDGGRPMTDTHHKGCSYLGATRASVRRA